MTIDYHGPRCPCGKCGCIEALASGPNIARRAQARLIATSRIVQLAGSLEQVRAEHVGQAFREGDAVATDVLTETAHLLTVWLGNIVDLLEPDVMVVGGGVAEMMSSFFAAISKDLRHWAINQRAGEIPLVLARYGADAGIAGAAALIYGTGSNRPSGSK
jgi:glucokinase